MADSRIGEGLGIYDSISSLRSLTPLIFIFIEVKSLIETNIAFPKKWTKKNYNLCEY